MQISNIIVVDLKQVWRPAALPGKMSIAYANSKIERSLASMVSVCNFHRPKLFTFFPLSLQASFIHSSARHRSSSHKSTTTSTFIDGVNWLRPEIAVSLLSTCVAGNQ
jgi:hypothetical protein